MNDDTGIIGPVAMGVLIALLLVMADLLHYFTLFR
jgi:tetrahydromethanopterin S-methyltransferase subunit F